MLAKVKGLYLKLDGVCAVLCGLGQPGPCDPSGHAVDVKGTLTYAQHLMNTLNSMGT